MDSALALYRRYRPKTFDEVIGQEHVTVPLQHALANNRVHHAYLFSGPRGCGKTTSARILARELNGLSPDDPMDVIDIIEIDAASHGGVDDARELRERAFFAPVNSKYKIYIIDEAHMVSPQGFNALLKLVEEPPPHLKFIFATTEPDKVIGTIRSRTHHYPFRLVPPKLLSEYLQTIADKEGIAVDPNALPMIVRAGGGSVRDTLSVLDQLIAGAGSDGVTYQLTTTLLGYTPDELLDELVDAVASRDGDTVFRIIDRVIESGQDPRRFTEDFLRRLRDLIIAAAVRGDGAEEVLDASADRLEMLRAQASRFGPAEITRAADIVSGALKEFRGATAPRIMLELMAMRILLPSGDDSNEGINARLERVERRLDIAGDAPTAARPPAKPVVAAPAVTQETGEAQPEQKPEKKAVKKAENKAQQKADTEVPTEPITTEAEPAGDANQTAAPAGNVGVIDVRKLWPQILDEVKAVRRFAWVMLSQNAKVMNVENGELVVALPNEGARDSFLRSDSDQLLASALNKVLGVSWRVTVITGDIESRAEVESKEADAAATMNDPVDTVQPEELLKQALGAEIIEER